MPRIPVVHTVILLLVAGLFTSCSEYFETTRVTSAAAYDMSHHELGSTQGQWDVSVHTNFGLGYSLNSETSFYGLQYDSLEHISSETMPFYGTYLSCGVDLGVLDRLDLCVRGNLGSGFRGSSYGGKVHLKYCYTDHDQSTQASIMTGIGYSVSAGSHCEGEVTDFNSKSTLVGYELVLPFSARTKKDQWFTFTPKLFLLDYGVTAQSNTPRMINGIPLKATDNKFVTVPAVGLGYRWGSFHPEILLVVYENNFIPGISFASVVDF